MKICDLSDKFFEIDFKIKDYRQKLTKILRTSKFDFDLTNFIECLKNLPEDKKAIYKILFEQIKYIIAAIEKNNNEKKNLKRLLFMNIPNAEIEIYKNLNPPVTIIFFDKILKIISKKTSVKFTFDQVSKNIVINEK